MPYLPLVPAARSARLELAFERWGAILRAAPELESAVALQRQLITLILDTADAIQHAGLPRLSLPPRYLAAKLRSSVPVLAGEPVPLPLHVLGPALVQMCEALGRGGAGEAADHIRTLLTETRMDAGSLLTASLGRDHAAIRQGALHRGLAPDLLWLVAELAVSPMVHALQQSVLLPATPESDLRAALDGWPHGYCPLCGSWPALAETTTLCALRCSFCALAWARPAPGCAYCGTQGHDFIVDVPDGSRPDRRLELCHACRAYLKSLDVSDLSPFPLVAIGDLETTGLDVSAMERGYSRPPLREFTSRPRAKAESGA